MVAALFMFAGLIWLICALAAGDRVPRPVRIRTGDTVKVQHRLHVYVEAKVLRTWFNGETEFAEVLAESTGEKYIRPMDLLTLVRES